MEGYNAGKDMARLEKEIEEMSYLIKGMYTVIDHNIKAKKLDQPPEPKQKQ